MARKKTTPVGGVTDAGAAARNRALAVIKALMGYRDVSGRQLAAELGMTQPQLSERLSGKRRMSVEEMATIADYFGVPIGALFHEVPLDFRRGASGGSKYA